MYASRYPWLTVVLFGALVAGCVEGGGRGSSGFDITENVIINKVLESQKCLSNRELTFCPADQRPTITATATATATAPTPTAPASPTPTPTVIPTPHVDTGLADGTLIPCTRPDAGAPCSLLFSFAGFGFPGAASFRVASRLRAPDGAWELAAPPTLNSAVDPPALDTLVSIPVPADASEPHVQFAVLVFLAPPAAVPARFEALAQSGADFAFVTPEFVLEIITTGPPPTSTLTPTPVSTTPSPTPSAPTPTSTSTPPLSGPVITYFGVARADSVSLAPSDVDPAGRPIYVRPFGHGLSLIVEGHPGAGGRSVGSSAYEAAGGQPDLQMILSRPIGNGSEVVCDRLPPSLGGVPATVPFAFSDALPVVNAINDLGCRVDDGQGNPVARTTAAPCTLDRSGDFSFVDTTSTAQFCLPIAGAWAFANGDTLVAARLRDVSGNLGPPREIVVRNVASSEPSPTPATPGSPPPTAFTPTPVLPTPPPSTPTLAPPTGSQPPASLTPTPPVSPTPTPTATPASDGGPVITHLGLARADDRPLAPLGEDAAGRPIYASRFGFGITLLVEARPGAAGQRLGLSAYSPGGQPDLQLIVSRPLGNGSAIVCDTRPPLLGGVPATDPLVFADDAGQIAAMNDLGCRVDDGTGQPVARATTQLACTRSDAAGFGFAFVSDASTAQYCLPIAGAWAFSTGDTVVAARARDINGRTGAAREIVIRVGDP